jgi:hypothetical protein
VIVDVVTSLKLTLDKQCMNTSLIGLRLDTAFIE